MAQAASLGKPTVITTADTNCLALTFSERRPQTIAIVAPSGFDVSLVFGSEDGNALPSDGYITTPAGGADEYNVSGYGGVLCVRSSLAGTFSIYAK